MLIKNLKFTDIKVRNIVLQHLAILAVGLLLFYLEKFEIASLFWEKAILLMIALAKSIYFIEHSFKRIEEASVNDISYNHFLGIILTNILLIVISFAVDFFCLELIQPGSFRGLSVSTDYFSRIFDFCYFSLTSFTTVAYGDIVPMTKAARSLAILEVGIAYVTTIIVISNFVQIKESMSKGK